MTQRKFRSFSLFLILLLVGFGLPGCKNSQSSKQKLTQKSEFGHLIGLNTPASRHVKSEKDAEILTILKAVYDRQQAKQYEKAENYKIPKVIHCIWIGPKPFPQASVENMRTWVAKHPDWQFKFWTDRQRLPPCSGFEICYIKDSDFSRLKPYYDQADNWGEKADYLRYEILYREGGVYIDHDANALQKFDQLNCAYDFYGCAEAPHSPILDMAITVGNGLVGTKPRHPILKGCIEYVEKNWQEIEQSGRGNTILHEPTLVMQRSYIALTRSIMKYLDQEGNSDIVFPASYFFASKYLPSFYSHHFYATAWAKQDVNKLRHKILDSIAKEKKSVKIQQKILQISILLQLILGFGLNTPASRHVKSEKDAEILTILKAVYDRQQAKQYEKAENYKIPKVIHCIWIGPKPFPQASVENMRTWVAKHPDWQFKFWTDRQRLPPCSGFEICYIKDSDFSRLKPYYDQADNWGEKADYLRYEILYREGGVYIDHDANALQKFDQLNCAYDFYGCAEAPHSPILDMAITVGNGLVGTKPRHPILKGCIEYVEKNWQEIEQSGRGNTILHEPTLVMQRSYIALTRSIMKYLDQEGNSDIVFPASYFFASKYLPSFYSHHFYATAWAKQDVNKLRHKILDSIAKEKKSVKIQQKILQISILLQLILGLGFILIKKKKNAKY
ncbi:MAG: hypothetical protein H7A39_03245 [Chlamydiales bacterium]|nr:hypothetical protein [Chlamydiales bacterium]